MGANGGSSGIGGGTVSKADAQTQLADLRKDVNDLLKLSDYIGYADLEYIQAYDKILNMVDAVLTKGLSSANPEAFGIRKDDLASQLIRGLAFGDLLTYNTVANLHAVNFGYFSKGDVPTSISRITDTISNHMAFAGDANMPVKDYLNIVRDIKKQQDRTMRRRRK